MREAPKLLETSAADLAEALRSERIAVFDAETSDVRPDAAIPVGLGVYLPDSERVLRQPWHLLADERFPRVEPGELAAAIQPFLGKPRNVAVMHNAAYDLRILFKLGIDAHCRVACTLVLSHRADENLRSYGKEPTFHHHLDRVTYGLKELTVVYFNRRPPSLHAVVGDRNPLSAGRTGRPILHLGCRQHLQPLRAGYDRHPARPGPAAAGPGDRRPQQRGAGEDDGGRRPHRRRGGAAAEGRLRGRDPAAARKSGESSRSGRRGFPERRAGVLHRLRCPDIPGVGWEDEEASHEAKLDLFRDCEGEPEKRKPLALLIAKAQMQQRCSAFLEPQPDRVRYTEGRLPTDSRPRS